MKIQINSDKQVGADATFADEARQQIQSSLIRFAARITRVEVHLSDVNSPSKRGFPDKRCFIEARPAGEKPVVVSNDANEAQAALRGAVNKLKRLFSTRFGKAETALKRSPARPAKRTAAAAPAPTSSRAEKTAKRPATKAGAKKRDSLSARGPKKKQIYQQRRKAQPARRGR
ncbi:MAG TPA: HPF/RaiA family ribosome-associated protein [Bryobacteraceae bacterium]|jgi:hypothetical protein|nr:HPF/RaiA family ribosome-associated protein [Bryobacteraceae bacterium]